MFSPDYDYVNKVLEYDVSQYNVTSVKLQEEFGQTTIVVNCHGAGG